MLGISSDAVRKRAKRGTLAHETGPDGKLYVWVDDGRTGGESGKNGDVGADVVARDELVRELRDRVRALEEANSENRRIIAALASRIPPAIEAPRESPQTVVEEPEGVDTPSAGAAPPEGAERPSWWRRVFFGEQ